MKARADFLPLVDELDRLARKAATAILDVYGKDDFAVQYKDDASPLTEADLESHRILTAGLERLQPQLPVLSEENAAQIHYRTRRAWDRYWLVDPLDGTREFLKRNGEFTVNIALIEFGRPVIGVVHVPVSGKSYIGRMEAHAELRRNTNQSRAIRVSGGSSGRRLRIVGSRSHGGGELDGFARTLGKHEFLAIGSSLKFCLVAEGRADAYLRLRPTSEWDTAAGHAVLAAAGGTVTDLDGLPLRYNARESLINPSFLASGDLARDFLAAANAA